MKMFINEIYRKRLIIKFLLKALILFFIVFTQSYRISNVYGEENSENMQKIEQITNIIQKADTLFERKHYIMPKDANAYDLYQYILKTDPSNQHALSKIDDIFNALLDSLYEETQNKFEPAMKYESDTGEVNKNINFVLKEMLNILEDLKKICKAYPNKDSEIENTCTVLGDKIKQYNQILFLRR